MNLRYDSNQTQSSSTNKSSHGNNFTPEIEYFNTSSPTFEYGAEITFSWKTINADKVTIKPFSSVTPIGRKTVKFKDFKSPVLTFEIQAENTVIQRFTKLSLTIKNKTYATV